MSGTAWETVKLVINGLPVSFRGEWYAVKPLIPAPIMSTFITILLVLVRQNEVGIYYLSISAVRFISILYYMDLFGNTGANLLDNIPLLQREMGKKGSIALKEL